MTWAMVGGAWSLHTVGLHEEWERKPVREEVLCQALKARPFLLLSSVLAGGSAPGSHGWGSSHGPLEGAPGASTAGEANVV